MKVDVKMRMWGSRRVGTRKVGGRNPTEVQTNWDRINMYIFCLIERSTQYLIFYINDKMFLIFVTLMLCSREILNHDIY